MMLIEGGKIILHRMSVSAFYLPESANLKQKTFFIKTLANAINETTTAREAKERVITTLEAHKTTTEHAELRVVNRVIHALKQNVFDEPLLTERVDQLHREVRQLREKRRNGEIVEHMESTIVRMMREGIINKTMTIGFAGSNDRWWVVKGNLYTLILKMRGIQASETVTTLNIVEAIKEQVPPSVYEALELDVFEQELKLRRTEATEPELGSKGIEMGDGDTDKEGNGNPAEEKALNLNPVETSAPQPTDSTAAINSYLPNPVAETSV